MFNLGERDIITGVKCLDMCKVLAFTSPADTMRLIGVGLSECQGRLSRGKDEETHSDGRE